MTAKILFLGLGFIILWLLFTVFVMPNITLDQATGPIPTPTPIP